MQRAGVVGCDDRDRLQAELARGAEDAQRDLTAVRNEHPLHARQPPVHEQAVERPEERIRAA